MRRLAATALALCGCNQIYGLDPTRARDAAPDTRSSELRMSMLFGQSTTDAKEAMPFIAQVMPDPMVKAALLAEELGPVTYRADNMSGIVEYPFELVGQRWRLEYTPPFDVAHEIQWSPGDGAGHIIVPFVGRLDRTAAMPNTGYTLSLKLPGNVLYDFSPNTVLYTSGYWSETASPAVTMTPTLDFSTVTPMSGPRGAPSMAAGDVVVAIDYLPSGTCQRAATISGSAVPQPLSDGTLVPLDLVRFSETDAITIAYENETIVQARERIGTALGTRTGTVGGALLFGRMAHTGMPFTTTIAGVPAPQMITLAECAFDTTSLSANHAGGGLTFTKGVYVFATDDRTVDGALLRSSIAAVGLFNQTLYQVSTHVPLAKDIKLDVISLEAGDNTPINAAIADLTFTFESDPRFVVDYYEVTLYRIANATLTPIRTYVGIDLGSPKVRFDPAVMTAGDQYVFAIRTYRGRPNARVGDFRMVTSPQAVATNFTNTFKR